MVKQSLLLTVCTQMFSSRFLRWSILLLPAVLLGTGCEQVEEIRDTMSRRTPHEAYVASLEDAGLESTALGTAWVDASVEVLDTAAPVTLPFREIRYLDPAQPAAIGFRFELERGQQLLVDVATPLDDSARVFIDLFEAPLDSASAPRHLQSAADTARALTYNVRRDQAYLLRIQPELLRGGRFQVTIQTDASLAFPVAGTNSSAIRSYFGDSRDGGRRRHHGVDIFAPRGTPAIAAADGVVSRVRNGGLGGKTVWLRDHDGNNLYYAHLDSQLVQAGTRVSVGDTVGLVGNTGNARTTPPHLHFGIYRNGPMNPYPFIHQPTTQPATLRADTTRLGQWARTSRNNATLRRAPDTDADALRELPSQTGLYVTGGTGAWYHVHLPDGTSGYLAASLVELAQRPLRHVNLAAGKPVRTRPMLAGATIDSLAANTAVPVLARFDDFLYVAPSSGRAGWIQAD